jgi:outer membrane protein assembly factor BamB
MARMSLLEALMLFSFSRWLPGLLLVGLALAYVVLREINPTNVPNDSEVTRLPSFTFSNLQANAPHEKIERPQVHVIKQADPRFHLEMLSEEEWPQFRGPDGQGHAAGRLPPLVWGENENVAWKVELPGQGWSSPVVKGDQLWLTTTVEVGWPLRALCLNVHNGQLVHDVEVFSPGIPGRLHPRNSHATPTPVIDGDRVYVHFGPYGTACLSTNGQVLWRASQDYTSEYGPSSSPIVVGESLIVHCDGSDVCYTVALDKYTGQVRWKKFRKGRNSESTPLLIEVDGKAQLISNVAGRVLACDPVTGEELWWVAQGNNYAQVPRPIFGQGLVFASGGYFDPLLCAIRPNGNGDVTKTHVAWSLRHSSVAQLASPLLVGSELYMVSNGGIVSCLDAPTGHLHWRERLVGEFSASPFVAGNRIYFMNDDAVTTVLASGTTFHKLASNRLEGRAQASAAVAGGAILIRTEHHLYCIAAGITPS